MHIFPTLLEEHGKHGTHAFPCRVHSVDAPADIQEKIHCHWHNEVELLHIRNGKATLQIGEKQYPVSTGDTILIPAGSVHMVNGDCSPFSFTAVVFMPKLIHSFTDDLIEENYITPVILWQFSHSPVFHNPLIQSWIQQIAEADQIREDGYELTIKIRILEILQEMYRYVKDFKVEQMISTDEKSALLKAMVVYLHEHENMPVSLKDMSDNFHISKGHLCRFFHDMTNMTVIEYLNYYRISRSVQKLKHTDLSISEIAQQTGFINISYFNRTFRKYMRQSPGQFRKRI